MAVPSGSDLRAALIAEGFTIPAGLDLDRIAAAAYDWFQNMTGWHPYIAASSTKVFDPPMSNVLRLRTPIFSFTSLTVGGLTKTLGTDFWLEGDGPWSVINFQTQPLGREQTISVTALWGAVGSISSGSDEYEVILDRALGKAAQELIRQWPGGGADHAAVGDVSVTGALVGLRMFFQSKMAESKEGWQRFRRVTIS